MKRGCVLLPFTLALGACSTGEGQGSVRSDRLIVKNCWDGPFDLQPDFHPELPEHGKHGEANFAHAMIRR